MKHLKRFNESNVDTIISIESKTRTKSISEDEFLEMIKKNCKNFSFMNELDGYDIITTDGKKLSVKCEIIKKANE
jgi:hypothetical protein